MTVNSAAEKLFLKKGGGFYECTILTEHQLSKGIFGLRRLQAMISSQVQLNKIIFIPKTH